MSARTTSFFCARFARVHSRGAQATSFCCARFARPFLTLEHRYKTLASSSTPSNEKAHLFGYLYSICDLPAVANLIANSSFVTLLIRCVQP